MMIQTKVSRSLFLLILASVAGLAETQPCTMIDGDQILGSDLARALPVFRTIAPATRIAPAPLPGGMRIFTEPELASMGTRFGVSVPALSQPVCFRVSTGPVDREAVIAAMERTLQMPEARIELADVSSEAAPPGVVRFPLEGLAKPGSPDGPAFWRGEVVSGARHFNIWARVRILAPVTRYGAVEELRQNVPVQAKQIRAELVEAFPSLTKVLQVSADSMVGLLPVRNISAGAEIKPEYLVKPLDVARGDLVRVEVRLGGAHLNLSGRAEGAGRLGDMIAVRNTESSRIFQARVEGKDRVLVDTRVSGEDVR
jgi:flagella basal body P-ring formation protein FlgA